MTDYQIREIEVLKHRSGDVRAIQDYAANSAFCVDMNTLEKFMSVEHQDGDNFTGHLFERTEWRVDQISREQLFQLKVTPFSVRPVSHFFPGWQPITFNSAIGRMFPEFIDKPKSIVPKIGTA